MKLCEKKCSVRKRWRNYPIWRYYLPGLSENIYSFTYFPPAFLMDYDFSHLPFFLSLNRACWYTTVGSQFPETDHPWAPVGDDIKCAELCCVSDPGGGWAGGGRGAGQPLLLRHAGGSLTLLPALAHGQGPRLQVTVRLDERPPARSRVPWTSKGLCGGKRHHVSIGKQVWRTDECQVTVAAVTNKLHRGRLNKQVTSPRWTVGKIRWSRPARAKSHVTEAGNRKNSGDRGRLNEQTIWHRPTVNLFRKNGQVNNHQSLTWRLKLQSSLLREHALLKHWLPWFGSRCFSSLNGDCHRQEEKEFF